MPLNNSQNNRLAVVICTYNRSGLLIKTLDSLYSDGYNRNETIDIVVVANNCTDGTIASLFLFKESHPHDRLNLTWLEEPQTGKSHALNSAIKNINNEVLCFIDDDQTVEIGFLENLLEGIDNYPEDSIFCGRIWPAWDGSEPPWVHAKEPYVIPIRPFPEFDLGSAPLKVGPSDRYPSGGNISVRRKVFERIGLFTTELGPIGHNLAGGEDHDFLRRAMENGYSIRYLPKVRQLHAVDEKRMGGIYALKKSYFRSRSSFLISSPENKPRLYMFRKMLSHLSKAVFTFNPNRRFFYLIRLAASTGELTGAYELSRAAPHHKRQTSHRPIRETVLAAVLIFFIVTSVSLAWLLNGDISINSLLPALAVASAGIILLMAKSLSDFSQTGPQVRQEILTHYRWYIFYALSRLALFAFVILFTQALLGILCYEFASHLLNQPILSWASFLAGLSAVILITGLQVCRHLLYLPASLVASSHYRISRLYPLWRLLSPLRLRFITGLLVLPIIGLSIALGLTLFTEGNYLGAISLIAFLALAAILALLLRPGINVTPVSARQKTKQKNILMIGSDTLRADRIGPDLTPFINQITSYSTQFTRCYVPCARTAPSLISLLTGSWPHSHGVRDNFVADKDTALTVPALPELLRQQGYNTAALSDWCGSDMGKFTLGFDYLDLPEDQWNLKFFIRQGPKDLRLFLSLFTHNIFGKAFLPEIHYLGGIPLTDELGIEARLLLNKLALQDKPFMLNIFFSTTHPPFGSEYPYYTMYSTPAYAGESKFVMSRLTDPWEILRRQAEPREEFDLDQIMALYDACALRFDDEVARVMKHLDACGLSENTIVVLYSDHGMEFFEHDTWGQGNSAISDHSAHIPLIILDPRIKYGRKVNDVVRSIDLAPTLLDLLALQPVPQMDGVSLSPYLHDPSTCLDLDAYNETGIWLADMPGMHPDHRRYPNLLEMLEVPNKDTGTMAIKPMFQHAIINAKDRMLRSGRWKLVYQPLVKGQLISLYDTDVDPECRDNVASAHPAICTELWAKLQAIMAKDSICIIN